MRRREHHRFVTDAVERAGGRVLASTGDDTAPLFLGVEDNRAGRIAVCAYVFKATGRLTPNRPSDEHRLQIRYGNVNSEAWRSQVHRLGVDPLGVDVTVVLGAHIERAVFVGLDPAVYNPLPLGISVEFKEAELATAQSETWHVWERDNIKGARRPDLRTPVGIETLVAFTPDRLLDFIRFEQVSRDLGLDPALRFAAAVDAREPARSHSIHALEATYGLSAQEILDIIAERHRLGVAVKGGVAERHLEKTLLADPGVATIELDPSDGPPDFVATMRTGSTVRVECKNASPILYADGSAKVETQKTRASKSDPTSRLYDTRQFDVIAACMFGPTGRWEFRFQHVSRLARDERLNDRLSSIQRIDDSWASTLGEFA